MGQSGLRLENPWDDGDVIQSEEYGCGGAQVARGLSDSSKIIASEALKAGNDRRWAPDLSG
jgi:hypothetical protein